MDTELTLAHNDLRLTVSTFGASLRGLSRLLPDGQTQPIITGYSGAENKVGGQGDVLIPFPGRVAGGRYTFAGRTYQMEQNDKDGPNAIHGFLRKVIWEMEQPSGEEVTFRVGLNPNQHVGYPFSLVAQVTYRLADSGLTCAFTIENTGYASAPVAAGFHPYFTVGSELIDTDTLQVPFDSYLEFDNHLIPTGRVLPVNGTPYDFRQSRVIGETQINTCFLHPRRDADGLLRLRLSGPQTARSVTVWLDQAFNYVVLYSGDPLPDTHRRRALAIEPMTCGADAFNHPDWGLVSLAPGQTLSGTWGVTT